MTVCVGKGEKVDQVSRARSMAPIFDSSIGFGAFIGYTATNIYN
jgi:hypothetical protein